MITQAKADELINVEKHCLDTSPIKFPMPGDHLKLEAKSKDTRESFLFDVNRRGRLRLSKCTYKSATPLLRFSSGSTWTAPRT